MMEKSSFAFKIAGEIEIKITGYGPTVRRAATAIIREFAPELAIEAERTQAAGHPIRITIDRDAGRLKSGFGREYDWEGK